MNKSKPSVGYSYEHEFSFSQNSVNRFAEVTGDNNPIHLDEQYAASTPFKKPIMHGFLSGTIFSKVFGTIYPGEGTIYLKQEMIFKRPMFVNITYTAKFNVTAIDAHKNTLEIDCKVVDADEKVCIDGKATLMNKRIFE
ncbi:MAG: MaoC family dehydratase [Bacteroidota bacterium]